VVQGRRPDRWGWPSEDPNRHVRRRTAARSVYDGKHLTPLRTWTSKHLFYHGALSKDAIDSVVESIGVPRRYAYADKYIGGDSTMPAGWSISGGHCNDAVLKALRPAGQPGRDESLL
jgi:hypothetical protein